MRRELKLLNMKALKKSLKTITIISITIIISYILLYKSSFNGYKVSINKDKNIYVKKIEDLQGAKDQLAEYLRERFEDGLQLSLKISKVRTSEDNFKNTKEVVNELEKTIKVDGVEVKSDGKKIAILANEEEIKSFIKVASENEKDKVGEGFNIKLKNKITYINKKVYLEEVTNIEELVKKNILTFNSEEINKKVLAKADNNTKSVAVNSVVSMFKSPTLGVISSYFGMRYNPILGYNKLHTGIDIAANLGTSVVSPFVGEVTCAGWVDGYGKTIILKVNNLEAIFGHLSEINVSIGQKIEIGAVIGKVGSTGNSTGPHLHFEVRKNGKAENPMPYIK